MHLSDSFPELQTDLEKCVLKCGADKCKRKFACASARVVFAICVVVVCVAPNSDGV